MEDYPATLLEFEERFNTEEACRRYLLTLRWPEGFRCPACGGTKCWTMSAELLLCSSCRYQASVTAGTVFQDTHLPLRLWFRAMWQITNHKNGISALGLQRALGLGSYRTAWTMLHKLRRAMVRPARDQLRGVVEVDETFWGGPEKGVGGRYKQTKSLIIVAAEENGRGIGRIRLLPIPDATRESLHCFIHRSVTPGSTVRTDGLRAYNQLEGYIHIRQIQPPGKDDAVLYRVHRVISLLKRWLMGTHQGATDQRYLEDYLNEFAFRFNRRKSASRGKLFYRLAQHATQTKPATLASIKRNYSILTPVDSSA
jgi:transposase-like protein